MTVTDHSTESGRSTELIGEPSGGSGGVAGTWIVYRCELAKLAGQVRTRIAVAVCLLAPFAFVTVLGMQDSTPADTLFGRWVHTSGFAVPLVILGFCSQWAFPTLASIVAGDMFAAEDHFGTWATILTRSRSRSEIFVGKTLAAMTYALAVVILLGASSIAAGVLLVGHQPLVNLSGVLVGPGEWTHLVLACWATVLPPVLAFTALALMMSVLTRNSAAGIGGPVVLGLLMQLYALVNGPAFVQPLLLATSFSAWHGLPTAQPFYRPLAQGLLASATYTVVCLSVAYVVLHRRDMKGN